MTDTTQNACTHRAAHPLHLRVILLLLLLVVHPLPPRLVRLIPPHQITTPHHLVGAIDTARVIRVLRGVPQLPRRFAERQPPLRHFRRTADRRRRIGPVIVHRAIDGGRLDLLLLILPLCIHGILFLASEGCRDLRTRVHLHDAFHHLHLRGFHIAAMPRNLSKPQFMVCPSYFTLRCHTNTSLIWGGSVYRLLAPGVGGLADDEFAISNVYCSTRFRTDARQTKPPKKFFCTSHICALTAPFVLFTHRQNNSRRHAPSPTTSSQNASLMVRSSAITPITCYGNTSTISATWIC